MPAANACPNITAEAQGSELATGGLGKAEVPTPMVAPKSTLLTSKSTLSHLSKEDGDSPFPEVCGDAGTFLGTTGMLLHMQLLGLAQRPPGVFLASAQRRWEAWLWGEEAGPVGFSGLPFLCGLRF